MDIDQLIENLPDDPEHALLSIHQQILAEWHSTTSESDEEKILEGLYVQTIYEWVRHNSIGYEAFSFLGEINWNTANYRKIFLKLKEILFDFTMYVERHAVGRIIAEHVSHKQGRIGFTTLTAEEKEALHTHINSMRKLIEKSKLNIKKKNGLLAKLNILAKDVDLAGTNTDRFFGFLLDISLVAGQMATNAKPMIDEWKEALRILARSRAREEGVSLPVGNELPSLEDSSA